MNLPRLILASASRGSDPMPDRKSTRLNSSHDQISYAVFCLKKKKKINDNSNEHNNRHVNYKEHEGSNLQRRQGSIRARRSDRKDRPGGRQKGRRLQKELHVK